VGVELRDRACEDAGTKRAAAPHVQEYPHAMDTPEPPRFEGRPLRRISRAEYDRMVEAGIFGEDERVELVFGMVVEMSPIDQAHVKSVAVIDKVLQRALGDRAEVLCQAPLAATDDSEPEPDIYVTPTTGWHKHASRAYLVVEVARSSLRYDRNTKALLYALSDIDEYWVVDHVHGVVVVHRDRDDGQWRTITTHRRGEVISPLAFQDVHIAVAEIVPPEGA
jgi:Uma2 family endonuclease